MTRAPIDPSAFSPEIRVVVRLLSILLADRPYPRIVTLIDGIFPVPGYPSPNKGKLRDWLMSLAEAGLLDEWRGRGGERWYRARQDAALLILDDWADNEPAFARALLERLYKVGYIPYASTEGLSYESEIAYLRFMAATVSGDAAKVAEAWQQLRFERLGLENQNYTALWTRFATLALRFLDGRGSLGILPPSFRKVAVYVFDSALAAGGRIAHPVVEAYITKGAGASAEYRAMRILQTAGPQAVLKEVKPSAARALARYLAGDEAGGQTDLDAACFKDAPPKSPLFADTPLFPLQALWYLARGIATPAKLKTWVEDNRPEYQAAAAILWAIFRNLGKAEAAKTFFYDVRKRADGLSTSLDLLLFAIGMSWIGKLPDEDAKNLAETADEFRDSGARWYELELCSALADAGVDGFRARAEALSETLGVRTTLAALYGADKAWEAKFKLLMALKPAAKDAADESSERLVWQLETKHGWLYAYSQKRLKNGSWGAGKQVSDARLIAREAPGMTAQDYAVVAALYRGKNPYGFDEDYAAALPLLAGHPLVFLRDAPDTRVDLVYEDVELVVEETGDSCVFSFSGDATSADPILEKTGPASYTIRSPSDGIRKVAQIVGKRLEVPLAAKDQVLDVLKSVSEVVKVSSPLLAQHRDTVNVEPDARVLIHLVPLQDGLKVSIHVRPLGDKGPCLSTGQGVAFVTARDDGKLYGTTRDLAAEKRARAAFEEACPSFVEWLGDADEADILDPIGCLTALAELRDAGDSIHVEWPKGGALAVRKRGSGKTGFKLKRRGEWFEASGGVTLDDGSVLALETLLGLVGTARGNFVKLSDGVFLELEARFLKQLDVLAALGESGKGGLRLPPLALAASDLLRDDGAVGSYDDETAAFRARVEKAFADDYPIPETIVAELRPYQIDGYRWLCRLADIGAGACLADDMGLGKTLQALALMARRANQGPSLVVAPTSVCGNWMAEIGRFAPGMTPVLFGDSDRQTTIKALGPGQILVASYGLVVSEEELFKSVEWNVLVLDEAHAIKNKGTKRFKAALGLSAQARVAATGTPVQNHIGELWTLFQFLNPGYLGTQASYTRRFLQPVMEDRDETTWKLLRDIVRPFILRRTKSQVLADLPGKTEITLSVELSDRERAFYEFLRKQAVNDMAKQRDDDEGKRQIIALAHITRLRRACCHPSLVSGVEGSKELFALSEPSAKLDALSELIEELVENGHHALVFSQFVDHLSLIRATCEREGVSYEYLDGATPAAERDAAVKRFQSGNAELFLVSLKAGGVGLNLTGADYVIHMDPWWNPAIEDQASDRAHRIGQTKPVTVYRLVAKDSIEERIVALHAQKRELSDALLEGAEASARLKADELLALVTGD